MMVDDFNFDDLTPFEVPVTYKGKKYVLREASEDARCKYRNSLMGSAKLGPDGKPVSISGMADCEPLLVSLCLCQVNGDGSIRLDTSGNPSLLPLLTIRSWPSRIVKRLYEKAKDISDLKEEEPQKAMEKRFEETCKDLVSLSESTRDRTAWGEWMLSVITKHLESAPSLGPQEVQLKNEPSAMTATSV
jgi:hypothetical protein